MYQEICQVNLFIFKYVYNCCDHDSRISTGRWVGWGGAPPPWALGLFHHFNFLFGGRYWGIPRKMKIVDFR